MNYKLIKQDKNRDIVGAPQFVWEGEHPGDAFEQASIEMVKLLKSSELGETVEISGDDGPILRLKVDYKP